MSHMNSKNVKIPNEMDNDIKAYMKKNGYATFSEFAREALRDKVYKKEVFKDEFIERLEESLKDFKEGRTNSYSPEEFKEKFSSSEK